MQGSQFSTNQPNTTTQLCNFKLETHQSYVSIILSFMLELPVTVEAFLFLKSIIFNITVFTQFYSPANILFVLFIRQLYLYLSHRLLRTIASKIPYTVNPILGDRNLTHLNQKEPTLKPRALFMENKTSNLGKM